MRQWRSGIVGVVLGLVLGGSLVTAQPFPSSTVIAINQVLTGVNPFTTGRIVASGYLNWGATTGTNGYGLRDNAGTIQFKQSGGAWVSLPASGTFPTGASYWTRVPEADLSNETALSALATAILLNTTATGAPVAYAGTTCTNQVVTALSSVGAATCASVSLSTMQTGTLPVANGGTGLTAGTSGGILAYTAAGTLVSSAALTANRIVLGGGAGVAPTIVGSLGTTTTLLHGNAAGGPSFGAVVLTTDVSGTLPVANGGTGITTGTSGGVLSFTAAGTIASSGALTANALVLGGGAGVAPGVLGSLGTTTTLLHGNAAGAPTFAAASLTADVTGTLPATNGGTGLASYTTGDLIYASSATTLIGRAAVATGRYLRSAGAATAPVWSTLILPNAATTGDLLYASATDTVSVLADVAVGRYLRAGGVATAPLWSTLVLPNAATTGDILHATATDTVGNLAAVAVGRVLISNGVGAVPVYSENPRISTLLLGADLALSSAAPTVAAGCGTTPVITGTSAAFRLNVGTGGTATDCTLGLPTATNGWNCQAVENLTATLGNRADQRTVQVSSSTTQAVIENQTPSTGAAVAFTASDVIAVSCTAF
jgi:hypothetical protein